MTRNVGDTFKRRGSTYKITKVRWEPVYTLEGDLAPYTVPMDVYGNNDLWWTGVEVVKPWFELNKAYSYDGGHSVFTVKAVWEEGGMRYAAGSWRYANDVGPMGTWTRDSTQLGTLAFDQYTVVAP